MFSSEDIPNQFVKLSVKENSYDSNETQDTQASKIQDPFESFFIEDKQFTKIKEISKKPIGSMVSVKGEIV